MAVRAFDLTEAAVSRLEVLEPAPRRSEILRRRRRSALIAITSLTVPFAGLVVALGVAH
jgi:hypothetical protein